MRWHQHNIAVPDPATAVMVATRHLGPALSQAQDAAQLSGWWFIRKDWWRLRYRTNDKPAPIVVDLLNRLTADGLIRGWVTAMYEPETRAFGGQAAMEVAHDLFHHDSRHFLAYAARPDHPLGQREVTAILCSVLMRGAGLDWYEHGDVWNHVMKRRPCLHTEQMPPTRRAELTVAMRRLMTADAAALCDPSRDGPLAEHAEWVSAFEQAGRALGDLAHHGRLERGVLAHHIIFHANRAGLSITDQAMLAALAVNTVFSEDFSESEPSNP